MSTKRVAETELNHENWDQDDPSEHETMGTFKTASKEMLEKRVMRTAKRRTQASSDEPKKSAFSGFGGFNKAQPSSFDFLANLTNGNKANGGGSKSDTAVTSSLFSSNPTTTLSGGMFGIPLPPPSTTQNTPFTSTEIPSMIFSSSKADSTVGDSPFKMQSVSSSADSNAKSSTATHVSSTIFGVSSTSPNQNNPSTNTAFKQPVSSTSTAVQNSAAVATQSNSDKKKKSIFDAELEVARNEYYSKLKGLNESVSSWVVKHVAKTPLCFLSPIFRDYQKYLQDIQEEYEEAQTEIEEKIKKEKEKEASLQNKSAGFSQSASPNQAFGINTNAASTGLFGLSPTTSHSKSPSKETNPTKGFSLGATSTPASTSSPAFPTQADNSSPSQGFTFGVKSDTPVSPPSKGFSLGAMSTPLTSSAFAANPGNAGFGMSTSPFSTGANTPVKGFSFGVTQSSGTSPTNSAIGAAPFSFGIGSGTPFSFSSQTQQQTTETQKEDDEDQPPKVEYTPVVEENSVFDKKCKIFVKKDGNFVDKGVGTLFVKKIEESGKHQLLVRANTNLGTVLLNMILASAVPTQRMGKNNVMLVCIPTPDAKPPPTPVLIRVKTAEEADELLEILNKYKS